ncbi:hypothetical protein ABW45_12365 [Stenotrophomonas maltophilia]|nr:hypothetical protein ABW45_12365 [Stenotrophomonas maltophilia]
MDDVYSVLSEKVISRALPHPVAELPPSPPSALRNLAIDQASIWSELRSPISGEVVLVTESHPCALASLPQKVAANG